MAYDEGGGVEFQNGLLSTSRVQTAALPDAGAPINVIEQIRSGKKQTKQTVPAQQTQEQYREEFEQFEQQQGYTDGSGLNIPDDDNDLPFA